MTIEEVLIVSVTPDVVESEEAEYPAAPSFPDRSTRAEIILPRFIYIKDRNGRYLTERSGPQYATLTFQSGNPNIETTFETRRTSPSWYRLVASSGRYINRYYSNPGRYSTDGSSVPSFNVISYAGNMVYLRDNYTSSPQFISDELRITGAPVAHKYSGESSLLEIVQAATKNEIIDIRYLFDQAKVRDVEPVMALRTSVCNDSNRDVDQRLAYTYEKWAVGTWNNSAGVEIGRKKTLTFKAGVPFVTSTKFDISVSPSYTHEWGNEEGIKQIVISSAMVTVPPKKKARATLVVRNAQIEIPFSYTQRIRWADGKNEDVKRTGIYVNVDSWYVDVVLDNWEDM